MTAFPQNITASTARRSHFPAGPEHAAKTHSTRRPAFRPASDALRFGRGTLDGLSPPSEAFDIKGAGGRTIHMRQWWPRNQEKPAAYAKGPVVLLIHGLNGDSRWMAPMAEELMQRPDFAGARFYGLDIPEIAQHPGVVSKITRVEDLEKQVREAIEHLGEKHGGRVHAVGLSMGGFLLGRVAADTPPKELSSITLLCPAFKAHSSRGGFFALIRIMFKALIAKIRGKKIPAILNGERTPASGTDFSPMQKAIMAEQEQRKKDCGRLTIPSYYKLFWAMRKFRVDMAQNIRIPVQVFATEADNRVDLPAIRTSYGKFASERKELIIFKDVAHNPVLDPMNARVSQSVGNFIQGNNERPSFGSSLSVIVQDV